MKALILLDEHESDAAIETKVNPLHNFIFATSVMNKANCTGHFSSMVLVLPESLTIETSKDI